MEDVVYIKFISPSTGSIFLVQNKVPPFSEPHDVDKTATVME